MEGFLQQVFALVCSQTPDRSWAPGGILLPFDERCTGLYVGAAIAVALHLLLRFRLSVPLLWLQGLLLLQMVPLGFHLIPHGPVLRTLSGQLFSFGVVGYLWLCPGSSSWLDGKSGSWRVRTYLIAAGLSLFIVPASAVWGGPVAALTLSWLGFAGLVALTTLVLANLVLYSLWLVAWLRRHRCHTRSLVETEGDVP
jgi:uncharacterized membrane protein